MSVVNLKAVRGAAPKAAKLATACEQALDRDKRGKPRRTLANLVTVLALHEDWKEVLAYNAFAEHVVKLRPPPVRPHDKPSAWPEPGDWKPEPWSDEDTGRTVTLLSSTMQLDVGSNLVDQAVAIVARRNEIHPVREYLSGLEWDGTRRLERMLPVYFGAEDSDYTQAIGARFMISAVARVYQPGCQVDCMPVLESERQGVGKSSGLAILGGEWFSDTPIVIGDKDSYQALRGVWLLEWPELASMRGRESERVKAFVSARADHYRPSYGRRALTFQRQCVFAGTTNESEYLHDTTGNRRFWPVRCERNVDLDALRRDRDQLWAEAFSDYHDGRPWHVDSLDLREVCTAAQEERQVRDPWLEIVEPWLRQKQASGVTTTELLRDRLNLEVSQITRGHESRAGQILRSLGWWPRRERFGIERVRRYFPRELTP